MPHLNTNKIRKKVKKCLHQAQRVGPVTPLPIPTGPVGPIALLVLLLLLVQALDILVYFAYKDLSFFYFYNSYFTLPIIYNIYLITIKYTFSKII